MSEPAEQPQGTDPVLLALLVVAACSGLGLFAQAALAPQPDGSPWGPLEILGALIGVTWAAVILYVRKR